MFRGLLGLGGVVSRGLRFGVVLTVYDLKDEKTLKSNGPIPLYYKSLYGL